MREKRFPKWIIPRLTRSTRTTAKLTFPPIFRASGVWIVEEKVSLRHNESVFKRFSSLLLFIIALRFWTRFFLLAPPHILILTSVESVPLAFSQSLRNLPRAVIHLFTFPSFSLSANWFCYEINPKKNCSSSLIKCKSCVNKNFTSAVFKLGLKEKFSDLFQELRPHLELLEHKVLSRFPITIFVPGKCLTSGTWKESSKNIVVWVLLSFVSLK